MAAFFYVQRKGAFKTLYTREKVIKFTVFSVCDCFTCLFVNFFVATRVKINWHMSFVCAIIKITGYVGFVTVHVFTIQFCLWLCLFAILVICCMPSLGVKLPVSCVSATLAKTSTKYQLPTLKWLFHLPLGNNICHLQIL